MTIIIYAFFALIATLTNLGSQHAVTKIYDGPNYLPISILAGTLIGLITKYLLDKKFIFGFKPDSTLHDSKVFLLYSTTGVVTTVIFWGIELAFHFYFNQDMMRYLGGALGLSIGYIMKYHLDKRYVFGTSKK